jgi:hypothetical protein
VVDLSSARPAALPPRYFPAESEEGDGEENAAP